jgi:mevalonate kinase
MMSYEFQTTTHGKWILAGEHAVLRGHGALVFPIKARQLDLSYHQSTSELSANYDGPSGADTHLLFWSVLEQGMQILGRSLNSLSGHFNLYSSIPVGVGMGASAALCVAMARWFHAQGMLSNPDIHEFAKQLEHLFHGQSSGLDISGVAAISGSYFKQGACSPLQQAWQPRWFLSSCGQIGMTSHCINQVQTLWNENKALAASIDQQMADCVMQAKSALETFTPDSQKILSQAMNNACDCFQQWGLVSESLQRHMQLLSEAGAIAVKPTGSGGGGYVISLWEQEPPEIAIELIAI